tara:strand:- start:397 stop:1071 length:675 start_codon:yes stop_codon:yes gene_type:complete
MAYLGNQVAPLVQALEGKELKLDSDGDSSIQASVDDTVVVKTNNTTAITVDSSGNTTFSGAVEQSAMMIAQFTKTNNELVVGSLTPIDDLTNISGSNGFTSRGTQPTNSSGVLTLPSTGLYRVDAMWGVYTANLHSYLYGTIEYSTDSGSNFSGAVVAYQELAQGNGGSITTTYTHLNNFAIFNVTNASTFRLRFSYGASGSGNSLLRNLGHTAFLIQKIGASQ